MPKLKRYLKKGEPYQIVHVTDESNNENIRLTLKALKLHKQGNILQRGIGYKQNKKTAYLPL